MSKLISILLSAIFLCGCSPQKKFTDQLKGADSAVLTSTLKGYEDVNLTITGEELNSVIKAIANGRKLSKNLDACLDSQINFFKGSTSLASLNSSAGRIFG